MAGYSFVRKMTKAKAVKPPAHKMYRGDDRMENGEAKPRTPVINIVVENLDPDQAGDYSRRLMMPLIRVALKEFKELSGVLPRSDGKGPEER